MSSQHKRLQQIIFGWSTRRILTLIAFFYVCCTRTAKRVGPTCSHIHVQLVFAVNNVTNQKPRLGKEISRWFRWVLAKPPMSFHRRSHTLRGTSERKGSFQIAKFVVHTTCAQECRRFVLKRSPWTGSGAGRASEPQSCRLQTRPGSMLIFTRPIASSQLPRSPAIMQLSVLSSSISFRFQYHLGCV